MHMHQGKLLETAERHREMSHAVEYCQPAAVRRADGCQIFLGPAYDGVCTGPAFLALDSEPGTCYVFPSFIPHFVAPRAGFNSAARSSARVVGERGTRVSVALNVVRAELAAS